MRDSSNSTHGPSAADTPVRAQGRPSESDAILIEARVASEVAFTVARPL